MLAPTPVTVPTLPPLVLAQDLAHPFSRALALFFATVPYQFRRAAQAVQELAESVIDLSNDQGFPFWLALGAVARGWALAEQGSSEEGIKQIRQGITTYQATGARIGQPHYLATLAEAYGKAGQIKEALRTIDEALTIMRTSEERYYEAELYRLKGEFLLRMQRQKAKGK
jgi:predicted ATPase